MFIENIQPIKSFYPTDKNHHKTRLSHQKVN